MNYAKRKDAETLARIEALVLEAEHLSAQLSAPTARERRVAILRYVLGEACCRAREVARHGHFAATGELRGDETIVRGGGL